VAKRTVARWSEAKAYGRVIQNDGTVRINCAHESARGNHQILDGDGNFIDFVFVLYTMTLFPRERGWKEP
jgi:hypothetical protein